MAMAQRKEFGRRRSHPAAGRLMSLLLGRSRHSGRLMPMTGPPRPLFDYHSWVTSLVAVLQKNASLGGAEDSYSIRNMIARQARLLRMELVLILVLSVLG